MKLFLAPHHDDLLLSLGGYVLDSVTAGADHVVVIFSEESEELERVCSRLHHQLGLTMHFLALPEALKRGVSVRDCFRSSRTSAEVEPSVLDSIRQGLRPLVSTLKPRAIYSPLLRVHIDHALVRAMADDLSEMPLIYYEDQPYASLYRSVLAKECSGLLPCKHVSKRSSDVVSVLNHLQGLIPDRHLNRMLFECTRNSMGVSYTLWPRPVLSKKTVF